MSKPFFKRPKISYTWACVWASLIAAHGSPAWGRATEQLAFRIAPGVRYEFAAKMTHVVTYDLTSALRKMAGGRADGTTILEDRTSTLQLSDAGRYTRTDVDVRRFGGDHPKDRSLKQRISRFSGTLSATGERTNTEDLLSDAGDGALAELPAGALSVGQSWTFSRRIRTDIDLGQGSMLYTDRLTAVEQRAGHRIAEIEVSGLGPVDVASNLQAKGFKTAAMTLHGKAEFDLTAGLPAAQHYTGRVQWNTRVLWVRLGLIFDDTYDASAWKQL